MTSAEYWAAREAEALRQRVADEKAYSAEIQRIYSDMLDACQSEINAFYGKYAGKEGISLAEAKKRVSKLDIAAYERKAKRYVKDKDFSARANEEMRLYNTAMKINRLEMLKANIGLETIAAHNDLEKFMAGILQGRTEDELKRQAGILGKTVLNNAAKAHAIVNASFHNATFSDRIWLYQDLMKADLSKLLQSGLIQGKNPRALASELRNVFKVSTFNAERLMRTELARVQTEAQRQSFIRNDFDEYEFIVNGGCCEICQALSGKHFKVEKMMPGENAPPMHPHCRCSTAAYSDRQDYGEWLDYLDKGGSTESWEKLKERAKIIERNSGKTLEKIENSGIIRLDNKSVREWYIHAVSIIKRNISTSDVEERAKQAFAARNRIRIVAREMMADGEAKEALYKGNPNKSFEELLKSKMERKGLTREEALIDIFNTATKTNEEVNHKLGLGGNKT